jgi:hypothetical protein
MGQKRTRAVQQKQCHELAQTFKDLDAKRTMLAMADAWLVLAAQREKKYQDRTGY